MKTTDHAPNPVDAFLDRNKSKISEPYRACIREAAVKAINGRDINLNHCPSELRSELLDLILVEADTRRKRVEAEYLSRNAGKKFVTGQKTT